MKLTFKENFDLSKNTLQHRIVLDTMGLLEEKTNCTIQEITSMAYLATLQNACDENVVGLVDEEQKKTGLWEILENIIEPKALEVIGDNGDAFKSIIQNVSEAKNREIEINGKFFYTVREIIKQIGELDTKQISDMLISMNSLREVAKEASLEKDKEKEIEVVNEKMTELINKFKTAN